jgi:serine/threonine-protein kinase
MEHSKILDDTYSVEYKLGAGGGGSVYRAWHRRLRKYVVIKELMHTQFVSEESRRNEVEALKNIKSEHLPQIFDFLCEESRSFTIMEYIEGDSFNKLLKQRERFSLYRVIKWYEELASALESLHNNDICHSDIKPANIILMPNGKTCLIDFNVAIVKGNETRLVSRSRGYASPEQYWLFSQHRNRDESCRVNVDWKLSDIHNLGAAIYHILTGRRLKYDAEGRVLNVNFDERQGFIQRIGADLSSFFFIIERSTHPEPKNRFASASALSRTIQSLL